MSRDLKIYANSKYVCAISPIALAMSWDKGGREIARPIPFDMVFTILTHFLNKTAVNNYFVRTQGQWPPSGHDVGRVGTPSIKWDSTDFFSPAPLWVSLNDDPAPRNVLDGRRWKR